MKKFFVVAAVALAMVLSAVASYAVSEAGVLFLIIAPGARAGGMGEAFVAVADDATAIHYNPGGLAFQSGREVSLMYSKWLPGLVEDMYYIFGAYRHSIEGLGTIGANVTYINEGEQFYTTEEGPDVVGTFGSNEFAITLSYGAQLNEKMGLGVNLRFIRSNLAPFGAGAERGNGRANAFAVDVGFLYRSIFLKGLSLGVNLSNMGPKITYVDADQADPLPTNLRVGWAYKLLDQKYNKLSVAVEFNKLMVRRYKDGKSDPFYKALATAWSNEDTPVLNAGVEYWYGEVVALRTGYHYDRDGKVKYPTFGAGLKYANYHLDFAYIAAGEGHPLSGTPKFSLTVDF